MESAEQNSVRIIKNARGILLQLTGKGFKQYGYLKNFSLAFIPLLTKDNVLNTFSKAHVANVSTE